MVRRTQRAASANAPATDREVISGRAYSGTVVSTVNREHHGGGPRRGTVCRTQNFSARPFLRAGSWVAGRTAGSSSIQSSAVERLASAATICLGFERQPLKLAAALEKNQIHQGDCVELLHQVSAGSVDLVFADPPFNIGYHYDVYDDQKQATDYLQWCHRWISGVHRALKSDGTFWLAIGDEYAAELKIESQKIGFHCRSWVIWYYTFGVNCVNGFSRSHTHLFHFVKDPQRFTFNRFNPQIRVKSARQLVYADNRANPNGRLPDNTWVIRPQDSPLAFSPNHDTWYFARVAGTFKEREGFHGCQMPEQLLARIIRASSRPQEVVLDPFGGSGTTLSVAKKLGRHWMGFELSEDYTKYITQRLEKTTMGETLDGVEDPILSAPSTNDGKQRKKSFNEKTETIVINAFQEVGQGYPADYILCDSKLNKQFISECLRHKIGGNAYVWNRFLLELRKMGKLPRSTRQPERIPGDETLRYEYASEVAWRLISIDYRKTLDDIFCSPEFAAEFDRLAAMYGPPDVSSLQYRRAAVAMRKRTKRARETSQGELADWWHNTDQRVPEINLGQGQEAALEMPGVYGLCSAEATIYAGVSANIRLQVAGMLDNPHWAALQPTAVKYLPSNENRAADDALLSALIRRESPVLNCRLWSQAGELLSV